MRKFILISMITLAGVSLGACRQNVTIKQDAPGQKAFLTDGQIYDLHSGKIISSSELLADLATAQHLIIGEKHDNAEHHQIELWLIQNLLIQRPQGSVLLEMLTSEQQPRVNQVGTVAKLAMRQPFVLFKGLTFQKLCLPGAFRPGDHHNKMLRPGLCVVHASPQYL